MRQAWFKLSGSVAGRALLWLLSLLYGAACAIRQIWISCFPHERSVPYPVISVGNMTAGGTGKTTLTLYLVQELMARGYRAVVLTRGYKGGDEARLLEEKIGTHGEFKVLVGRNRYETARDYLDSKFKISDSKLIFIMDDGHQHTALKKDLSLVLIDASNPEALRGLLPYGWLREPLVWGLKRADAVIITHADAVKREDLDRLSARVHQAQPGLAVFYAR
ncbi:MAG: tetraacyldisaccharide 4'-kinase [Elusimicrobia bacterium]|nr:tetraacyldisaccharide 4'-kinase [Elusimicrobiota bacterium]